MAIVYRISQLKCENSVCTQFSALFPDLVRGESELVEAIVPSDPFQNLQFPSNEPISWFVDHFYVRMTWIVCSEFSATSINLQIFKLNTKEKQKRTYIQTFLPFDEQRILVSLKSLQLDLGISKRVPMYWRISPFDSC